MRQSPKIPPLIFLLLFMLLSPMLPAWPCRADEPPFQADCLPEARRRHMKKTSRAFAEAGFSLTTPAGRLYPDLEQLEFMWELRRSPRATRAMLEAAGPADAPLPERLIRLRRLMAVLRTFDDNEFMRRTRQMADPEKRAARYGFMLDVLVLLNDDLPARSHPGLLSFEELEFLWSRSPSPEQLAPLRHSGRLRRGEPFSPAELALLLKNPAEFERCLETRDRRDRFTEYMRREDVLPRLDDYQPGAARQVLAGGVVQYIMQPGLDVPQLRARLGSGLPKLREETLPNGLSLRRLDIKRPPALQDYINNMQALRRELRHLQPEFRRQAPCRYKSFRVRLACLAVRLASVSLENLRPLEIRLDRKNGEKLYALTYNSPETAANSRVYHVWHGQASLEDLAPVWGHFAPLEGAAAVFWSIVLRDNYFELTAERYAMADLDFPWPVNGRGRVLFTSAAPPEEIAAHLSSLSLINLPVAGAPSTDEVAGLAPYSAPPLLPPAPEDVYVANFPPEVFLHLAAFGGKNELERLFGPLNRVWIHYPVEARPEAPWLELSYRNASALTVVPAPGRIFAFSPQTRDAIFLPLVQARQTNKLARYLGRMPLGPAGSLMSEDSRREEVKRIIRLGYSSGNYYTRELLEEAGHFALSLKGAIAPALKK